MTKAKFNPEEPDKETYLKLKEMDIESEMRLKKLESGWFGLLFGSSKNASVNVAGLIVIFAVIAGILSFFQEAAVTTEIWKYITPIITAVLGFLFGKRS
jgi:hypothetical protein